MTQISNSNIQGLHLNFAEYESFPLTFLLLCETILDDWSDSGNFSVRGHLPLFNPKGFCYSYSWTCSLYEEGFPFAQNLSLQKSADSYLCFQLALLHSVSCFCLSITSLVFRWCYVRPGVVVSIRRIDSAKNRFYTKQSKIFFGPKNFHIWFFHYIYHVFWFFKKPWVKWMPAMKIL